MGSSQIFSKFLYYAVATPRMFRRVILTSIATTYYRLACKEFGKKSVVRWGTWMRYPSNISIGDHVFIGDDVSIGSEIKQSSLVIASYVQINSNVQLDYTGDVEIGEHTLIAEQSVIYSHSHGLDPRSQPTPMPKKIGANCWVGARCILLESCAEIASGTVVGAGAVVSKNLEKKAVYVGVPARFIRAIGEEEKQTTLTYAVKS